MAKSKKPELADPQTQARWFSRVRDAHQVETAEDYVELIADLIAAHNEARLSDLSARLGVSHATASKVLARLKDEGYVESRPYRSLFLTEKGEALARQCKERHEIVLNFLIALGVSRETAAFDAEGIEHHISAETLALFKNFKGKP
jgi:DtxR family manganese transport transcriptional regulator